MPLNNPFIKTNSVDSDIATAKLYEHATQTELGKINKSWANVPALTDGTRVYINSDEVLEEIMPGYKKHPTETLELLLHHENLHIELTHHRRYFQMIKELERLYESGEIENRGLTHSEVNIIMDILVHDVLFNKREGLTEIGIENLAQMRNRNSLKFTFKGKNLEDMLEEYARHKRGEDESDSKEETEETEDDSEDTEDKDRDGAGEGIGDTKSKDDKEKDDGKGKGKDKDKDKDKDEKKKDTEDKDDSKGKGEDKGHGEGSSGEDDKKTGKDTKPELRDEEPKEEETKEEEKKEEPKEEDHHDETDWSKLADRGDDEFITEEEADKIDKAISKMKRLKVSLSNLTRTLNGLATDKKERTYTLPSYTSIQGSDLIFKGHRRARTSLYLIFDASGSMGTELATFKEIISKSIPQAMNSPCEWFAGYGAKISPYKEDYEGDYYKGTFKDIMPVHADSGYSDDGDRVLLLCEQAERKGFTPIGVTDGGGGIREREVLKRLKKTVLVGTSNAWLDLAKSINPNIQTLCIYDKDDDRW